MSRRILVVEDEAPIREMLCFVLEQKGYQAVEAEDYDTFVTFENKFSHNFLLQFIQIFFISIKTSAPKFPMISTLSSSLEKIYVV